jgi:hypothetical protein
MAQFLLVRRDDFVHVGLQFSGFRLDQAVVNGGTRPHLVATSNPALITLTFPPQALAERAVTQIGLFVSRIFPQRAGSSQVQFAVKAGVTIELTASAIFAALKDPTVTVVSSGEGAAAVPTAIEIPWRVLMRPVGRSGRPVISDHSSGPVTSAAAVSGLWHARLLAADGDAVDAGLSFLPLLDLPGNMDPEGPLTDDDRKLIVAQHAQGLPLAALRRLELSAIGGSISVAGKWPSFEWSQDVVLGRDQKIRTRTSGVLYPFGHRATLITVSDRIFVLPLPTPPPPHPGPPPPPHPVPGPVHPPGNGSGNNPPPHAPPAPTPATAVAGLFSNTTLQVLERLRGAAQDAGLARQFPFSAVEILANNFGNLQQPSGAFFVVRKLDGTPLLIPVRCAGANGDVVLHIPMLFVGDGSTAQIAALKALWDTVQPPKQADGTGLVGHDGQPIAGVGLDLPGVPINMFPQATGAAGVAQAINDPRDVHEVHQLVIEAMPEAGLFRPIVTQFTAELPALRTLLQQPSVSAPLKYSQEFLATGDITNPVLTVNLPPPLGIGIDFSSRPERSGGLMAPKYSADAISRALGPIPHALPLDQAFKDATLLGLPLLDIVDVAGLTPPTIVPLAGNPPGASMTWSLSLKPSGPFQPVGASKATLTVNTIAPQVALPAAAPVQPGTTCRVESFNFLLPPTGTLVTLNFGAVVFTEIPGHPPNLDIQGLKLSFSGALQLLNDLIAKLQELIGASPVPTVKALPTGLSAGYSLAVPSISSGDFLLKNVAANVELDVPFTAGSVTVSLGFASRDNPFNLSVLALGGGGYIDVEIGGKGLSRFEASMEFGATLAVDFLIVSAEVHALGGVRFVDDSSGGLQLDAFIRIGGSVDLFGLVSVSVEVVVMLSYRDTDNKLVGRATLVIDVDLTLFSESVTLDTGDWVLAGSQRHRAVTHALLHATAATVAAADDNSLAGLLQYYKAFAP